MTPEMIIRLFSQTSRMTLQVFPGLSAPQETTMAEPVTLFTITSFFSEVPIRVKKGLNSFNSSKVVSVTVLPGGIIKGSVQASMKKKIYNVEVS